MWLWWCEILTSSYTRCCMLCQQLPTFVCFLTWHAFPVLCLLPLTLSYIFKAQMQKHQKSNNIALCDAIKLFNSDKQNVYLNRQRHNLVSFLANKYFLYISCSRTFGKTSKWQTVLERFYGDGMAINNVFQVMINICILIFCLFIRFLRALLKKDNLKYLCLYMCEGKKKH